MRVSSCRKDRHDLLHHSPRLKKACVRQVALDKWFLLNRSPDERGGSPRAGWRRPARRPPGLSPSSGVPRPQTSGAQVQVGAARLWGQMDRRQAAWLRCCDCPESAAAAPPTASPHAACLRPTSFLHRIQTPQLGGGHGESEPCSVGALA